MNVEQKCPQCRQSLGKIREISDYLLMGDMQSAQTTLRNLSLDLYLSLSDEGGGA